MQNDSINNLLVKLKEKSPDLYRHVIGLIKELLK
jgi:hypothetical protein